MDLVYVQTVLSKREVEELLKKAKVTSKKDALRKAVRHYIRCKNAGGEGDE